MDSKEYNMLQTRLTNLMESRLKQVGYYGKRGEGYEEAILAVKSMLSSEFTPKEMPYDT